MQAHLFISGKVQGVGFRYFVRSNAKRLGITGWVRNTEDGGVEVAAQGEKEPLEALIALCRKGPFLADVQHIGVEWEGVVEHYKDFSLSIDHD
ncbi:MAG TPA: acylphosphatase [Methylomirabilota bacterium]|nr:acylphosphatase [Methylomirabilota bacterium]